MKLCIDSADINRIKKIYEYYPVDGVSTNPSILAKVGRPPYEVLKEIRALIGEDAELFVQVISREAEWMVQEARRIVRELGERTLIKIPCVPEGYKAMMQLRKENIRFIGTAVYTPMQGYLAAKAGAEYVAPYINRIDNLGFDGIQAAKDIHDILVKSGYSCSVIAASFKNSQQVLELAKYGIGAATAAPDVIEGFVKNAAVTQAVENFIHDFEDLAGDGRTMENI